MFKKVKIMDEMDDHIDIAYLKKKDLILFEVMSGSRAYGLDNANSDIKGVFILPKSHFYGLNYIPQISDEKKDVVYYEIGRFVELLIKNNPTVIELISSPTNCIRIKDNRMNKFMARDYLSKLCKASFAGYAMSQIKKAKGLNKKIHNPMDKKRKTVLDFCYVINLKGSLSLKSYLEENNILQVDCGLSKVQQMQNIYALHHSGTINYNGIVNSDLSNDIVLTSIPKEETRQSILYFNKDGYSTYCKKHKEYWEWVENRNENRYNNTISQDNNYDAKNMMHTFRLLLMAKEIAIEGKVNVFRKDRSFLLAIKEGRYSYDNLIEKANILLNEIEIAFSESDLQEKPKEKDIITGLYEIRNNFYLRLFEY